MFFVVGLYFNVFSMSVCSDIDISLDELILQSIVLINRRLLSLVC